MSNDTQGDLDALIQGKIDSDTDFQANLETLSDEEKDQALNEKRSELIKQEFNSIAEQARKDKELANNYKIRAEKAEKGTPKKPEGDGTPKQPVSDSFDIEDITLLVTQVPVKEDRDIVKRYAKNEGKTLEEALKDPIVKGILKDNAEQRKTAEVTNTTGSRRVTQKETGDSILENAENGKLPTSDEAIAKLAAATVQKFKKK